MVGSPCILMAPHQKLELCSPILTVRELSASLLRLSSHPDLRRSECLAVIALPALAGLILIFRIEKSNITILLFASPPSLRRACRPLTDNEISFLYPQTPAFRSSLLKVRNTELPNSPIMRTSNKESPLLILQGPHRRISSLSLQHFSKALYQKHTNKPPSSKARLSLHGAIQQNVNIFFKLILQEYLRTGSAPLTVPLFIFIKVIPKSDCLIQWLNIQLTKAYTKVDFLVPTSTDRKTNQEEHSSHLASGADLEPQLPPLRSKEKPEKSRQHTCV